MRLQWRKTRNRKLETCEKVKSFVVDSSLHIPISVSISKKIQEVVLSFFPFLRNWQRVTHDINTINIISYSNWKVTLKSFLNFLFIMHRQAPFFFVRTLGKDFWTSNPLFSESWWFWHFCLHVWHTVVGYLESAASKVFSSAEILLNLLFILWNVLDNCK